MICHCVFCGVAFSTKHKRKYCDACRKVVNETKAHVHGEQKRIKYAYEKHRQESKAKQTGMSIDEIVKEAKKEGLTYGQYVAKYRV